MGRVWGSFLKYCLGERLWHCVPWRKPLQLYLLCPVLITKPAHPSQPAASALSSYTAECRLSGSVAWNSGLGDFRKEGKCLFSAEKGEEEEHKMRMRKQASTMPVGNRMCVASDADSEQISLPQERRLKPAVTGHSQLSGVFCLAPSGWAGGGWRGGGEVSFESEAYVWLRKTLFPQVCPLTATGRHISSWRHCGGTVAEAAPRGIRSRQPWGCMIIHICCCPPTLIPLLSTCTHTHSPTFPLSTMGTRAAAEQRLVPCRQRMLSQTRAYFSAWSCGHWTL